MPRLGSLGSGGAKGFGFTKQASGGGAVGGALFAWGDNRRGQLGIGTTSYGRSSPTQVGSLTTWGPWLQVGQSNSSATKTDGTIWTWGAGNYAALAQGNTNDYSSPKQVGALTNWGSFSGGGQAEKNRMNVKTNGTLWGWGYNPFGQIGTNNRTYYSSPVQVGALTTWVSVSCNYNTAAIKTDGTLWTWGINALGALGLGNSTYYSSPKQVGSLTNWASACVGRFSTVAVKTNGTLWGWGYNPYGQIGTGNLVNYSSPKQIGALTNWSKVVANNDSTYAIKTDGTLWSWGSNNRGALGIGNTTYYSSPKQVGSLTTWSKLAQSAGQNSCGAIKTDGTLWMWGDNTSGTLGQGDRINRASPVQVGALTTWLAVAVGVYTTLATQSA